MAQLQAMPPIAVSADELRPFGAEWLAKGERLSRSPPYSSTKLGEVFDARVGESLAVMLGGIPLNRPSASALHPALSDCVEVGPCRIIGGIRSQNFDVGYRPDGPRFAFDSKTLNDAKSVQKNYQNMINDLGTEATTVHTRFPFAVVGFFVVIPTPCIARRQRDALTRTLERLTERESPIDLVHKAEAISFVLWSPDDGEIDPTWPPPDSLLRIERFSDQVERAYVNRYKGLPPHDLDEIDDAPSKDEAEG